jgi:hypothetical protein
MLATTSPKKPASPASTISIPQQRTSSRPLGPQPTLHPTGQTTGQTRGFFARRAVQLFVVGVATLLLGVVIGVTTKSSSAHRTPAAPASSAARTTVTAPTRHAPTVVNKPVTTTTHDVAHNKPAAAAGPSKPADKGWVVQSIVVKRDVFGDFAGTARISNTNTSAKTATFSFTLFRHGKQLGVLAGSAEGAAAGKTMTVELVSEDTFSAGSFTYDFQTDVSF